MTDGRSTIRARLPPLIVVALAVLPYVGSVSGGFVYDDPVVIRDNPDVIGSNASLLRTLSKPYPLLDLYRPVTMASYRLNALLGEDPFVFHVVNLLLHALASLCVWMLAGRVFRSPTAAFASAALFAVHPVHTEAVSNIAGRAEPLAALFSLVCVLLCLPGSTPARGFQPWRLAGACTALGLGVASKEGALVVPALVAILWLLPHLRPATRRAAFVQLLALTSMTVGFLGLRSFMVGSVMPERVTYLTNPLAHVPALERIRTAVVIAWQYVVLLFVPHPLSADYSPVQIPIVTSFVTPDLLVALAGFFLLGVLLATMARRAPEILSSAGYFFIPLALTGNFFFPIVTNKAERILYLPSVGWCLVAGWAASRLLASRRIGALAIAAVIVLFGWRTHVRNRDWQSNLTLWTSAIEVVPRATRAHFNLAVALERDGRIEEALVQYRITLDLFPRHDRAAASIGTIHQGRGETDPAVQWFARALAINPDNYRAQFNLGVMHHEKGEPLAAAAHLWAAHWSEPREIEPLPSLAVLAWMEGRTGEAVRLVHRAEASRRLPESARRVLAQLKQQLEPALRPPA